MLKRAWKALAGKTEHWSRFRLGLTIAVVAAGATAVGIAISAGAVVATSTENFCRSCHEHNIYTELKGTVHDKNRTGVRADCAACHIPHDSIVGMLTHKTVSGVKDIWGHYVTGVINTKEKFEKERHRLAVVVWTHMKKNDSLECRSCHDRAAMDPDKQNEGARASHAKMKAEGATCIDCHFGIAHNEPDGPGPRELKIAK